MGKTNTIDLSKMQFGQNRQVWIKFPAFKKLNELEKAIRDNSRKIKKIDILTQIVMNTELIKERKEGKINIKLSPPILRC